MMNRVFNAIVGEVLGACLTLAVIAGKTPNGAIGELIFLLGLILMAVAPFTLTERA